MAQRHDHLFQVLFGDEREAGPLLRTTLSPAIEQSIDWSSLTRRRATQRGRRGKRTICDLLFSVRLRTGPQLLLYVVLEHTSKSTRFDALQMLEQVTAVLRQFRRENPREPFLPPVLPIVVHADQHPWRSPLQVRDLFDLANIPAALHHHLPSLEFVLDDVREQPPEQLRQRALGILGLCGLSTLQYFPPAARDPAAFTAWLAEWRDVLQRASRFADETSNEALFEAVVEYVLDTCDLDHRFLHRVMDHQLTDDAMSKKFVSTRTQIRNEGRVDLLRRLLTRRFGADAAAAFEPRLQNAAIADIEHFADRVLDAKTIDEVFAIRDRD